MKATGIVRRIDDLGRVVIPKEIRRTMGIHEGDPLEIFVDKESCGITFVPYHFEASSKLRSIAESLDSLGMTAEHWKIAKELKELANKLEILEGEI